MFSAENKTIRFPDTRYLLGLCICYKPVIPMPKEASPSIGNTVTRFNDVHATGYNSAGSVRIRMKFGALRVYCPELALTDFGRDPRRSESGRPCGSFVLFCQVNNARLCRFPVSQFSRNLHTRRGSVLW